MELCLCVPVVEDDIFDHPYASGFHFDGHYTFEHANLLALAWLLNGLVLGIYSLSIDPLALLDQRRCFRRQELSSPFLRI